MSGSMMSRTTRSGRRSLTTSSASRPPCTWATSKPSYPSAVETASVIDGSSSTTTIRAGPFMPEAIEKPPEFPDDGNPRRTRRRRERLLAPAQPVDDRLGLRDRNDEADVLRGIRVGDRGVDADDATLGVDQRSAGVT